MRATVRILVSFLVLLIAMSLSGPLLPSKLTASARAGLCSRAQWLCTTSFARPQFLSAQSLSWISGSPSFIRLFSGTSTNTSAAAQFSWRISASYSAKGKRFNPELNLFNHNSSVRAAKTGTELQNIGDKDKKDRPASGQDSFFVNEVGTTGSVAFGVADGVGGWTESGVDPADFAHGICEYMATAANGFPEGFNSTTLHPKDLLQLGYENVMKDKTVVGGGSTACIATADTSGSVEVAK